MMRISNRAVLEVSWVVRTSENVRAGQLGGWTRAGPRLNVKMPIFESESHTLTLALIASDEAWRRLSQVLENIVA